MKPVFKEEFEFLKIDKIFIDKLWVDKRCYYGFDKKFNKVKLGRNIEKFKNSEELISHNDYCEYHYNKHTKAKVEREREAR